MSCRQSRSGATVAPGPALLLVSSLFCLTASLSAVSAAIHGYETLSTPVLQARALGPAHSLRFSCQGKRGIIDSSSSLRQGPGLFKQWLIRASLLAAGAARLRAFGGWDGGDVMAASRGGSHLEAVTGCSSDSHWRRLGCSSPLGPPQGLWRFQLRTVDAPVEAQALKAL